MGGASQPDGFTELESLSLGADAVVVADTERLLVGTPAGRLEIRAADGDEDALDVEDGVEDVALDGYVFVLADGTVTAYTTSGIELWSTTVTDPQRIVPVGREGVLACMTGDGRVVGIDTETGSELYGVQRPHSDVTADSIVVGGHGRSVIASWSFLVAFGPDGDLLFDRNIEGAIEDVASVSGGVVVRLKDGQLLRLDEEGDQQWSQATDASGIAAYENDTVLTVDGDGVSVVDDHGNVKPLPVPSAESVLATGDGRLVVTTANQTQTVYRRGEPAEAALSASLETDTVDSGERIRFRVDNDGEKSVDRSATLSVEPVDALRVRRPTATLSVPAGGSAELEFYVTEAVEPGDVSLELAVDGSTIGSDTVTVEQQRDLSTAVDVAATVESVSAAGVTVLVTATNTTASPVQVGLASTGPTESVGPDDTVEFETTVDRDAKSLLVTVSDDGETVEVPVAFTVDGTPSLSVTAAGSRSGPYLDVILNNGFDAPFSGTLSVTVGDEQMRLDRSVTLEPSTTLRLAVLLTSNFIADGVDVAASLDGVTETAATLRVSEWERDDDAAVSRDASPSATTESGDEETMAWDDTERTDTLPVESGQLATPTLDVERTTPESVRRGEVFTERIMVANTGTAAATDLTVAVGGETHDVGEMPPKTTVELVRSHAVFEDGQFSLPRGRVTAATETVDLAERTLTVEPPNIEVTVSTPTDGNRAVLDYRFQNRAEDPVRLFALGVKSPQMSPEGWDLDDETIDGGDDARFERAVTHDEVPDTTLVAGCQYQFPGSDRETYWTLVREDEASESGSEQDITVAVDAGSVPLVGRNSAIDCTATFAESMSDVTVEATGEMVSPLFVGEYDIGDVTSGESVTHPVDILPEDAGTASFDLTIAGTTADETVERRYTVTGPVAATESESVSEPWHAEQDGKADAESATGEGSTHLVTTFRS